MKFRLPDKFLFIIFPAILVPLIWLLGKTIKIKELGKTENSPLFKEKRKNVIYAFWHSRLLLPIYFYRNKNINVLISLSRDGEYVARIIESFGFGVVRGSTSKGAISGLKKMIEVIQTGFDAGITPDGPRGPKQIANIGTIYLASLSGASIVPFSFDAAKKIVLSSWDNFIIPLPFTKGVFVWGDEIEVPKDADEKILEEKRKELEISLNSLTQNARERLIS